MAMCTYLNEAEYTQSTSNKELNDMLHEVRQATGDDWRLCEDVIEVQHWFRKPTQVKLYTLYHHLHSIEFQIINFYDFRSSTSINISVEANVVAAYLLGILSYRKG